MNQSSVLRDAFNKDAVINFVLIAAAFILLIAAQPALAAGGLDNLNKSNDLAQEILDWLNKLVPLFALCYLLYLIAMTFFEKKAWSDVGMGLAYCAGAGGALLAGNYFLGMWD
ncbi:TrbC/VirB2 family protein [Morganella morganii subsp. sibonii]